MFVLKVTATENLLSNFCTKYLVRSIQMRQQKTPHDLNNIEKSISPKTVISKQKKI